MRRVKRALIVEDDRELGVALDSFMRVRADTVHLAGTKREAELVLRSACVDAALVDLTLPDGSGLEVLKLLWTQSAMPQVIVISGSATPGIAFHLAEVGVREFVPKPLDLASLERVWDETLERTPDIRPLLRASVGRVDLRVMEGAVRRGMVEEALAVAGSSRRRASRLLGISRQLLQHIIRGCAE